MEKIEINDENYQAYEDFLKSKNCTADALVDNHLVLYATACTLGCFAILFGGLTATAFLMKWMADFLIAFISNTVVGVTVFGGTAFLGIGTTIFIMSKSLTSGTSKFLLHRFKKKYPEFDIHLDEDEVEKELTKYYELSKIPENLEQKKEEHLDNHTESFKQMTVEEKLAFLNQEKEFWESVAIQEKYQNEGEDTTEQGKMGTISSTEENKNRVYHI